MASCLFQPLVHCITFDEVMILRHRQMQFIKELIS